MSSRPAAAALLACVATLLLAIGACTPERHARPTPSPPTTEPRQQAYSEPWRPQVHYSPRAGRMADPNGLVWYQDEWHLFHQQDGTWAHAVSADLVHWEPLPTALEHDDLGQALSGSVVVDGANTSGLFDTADGGLVAVYTSTAGGEAQSIAFSQDRGRTWQRYDGNPVLPHDGRGDFRDPKVFWYEPTSSWVMVVSVGNAVELFGSANLTEWTFLSRFGDDQGLHTAVWECPDLFPLLLDGDPDEVRWVLTVSVGASEQTAGSTAQYFVGQFDGETFRRDPGTPAGTVQQADTGQDFYAAQTFEHAPDGRRIWLGWMGNWQYPYAAPTRPWTNAMSLPRELTLRTIDGRPVLTQQLVDEVALLRREEWSPEVDTVDGVVDLVPPDGLTSGPYEIEVVIDLGTALDVGVLVHGAGAGGAQAATAVSVGTHGLVLDRTRSGPATLQEPTTGQDVPFALRRAAPYEHGARVSMRVVVDASSVEVFVDDGALTGTLLDFPDPEATGLALRAGGGEAHVVSATVWGLDSIWRPVE